MLVLAACAPAALAEPSPTPLPPTETSILTESSTPTITPSPTPEPRYEEIQGVMVPMNVYLEGEACIPMELQGEEKCVNLFAAGQTGHTQEGGPDSGQYVPGDFPEDWVWSGIVYVVGDVRARNLTIEAGTEVYVAANSDIKNLQIGWGESYEREGINYEYENLDGVHYGEPWYDARKHILIEASNRLIVSGEEDSMVLITSAASEPSRWDWTE